MDLIAEFEAETLRLLPKLGSDPSLILNND